MLRKPITLFFLLILCLYIFLYPIPAIADIEWEQAEEIVKSLPCSEGGTIDQYLTKKAAIPAIEDLGWHVYPRENGFEVERLLLLSQRLSMQYRWHVGRPGNAKPVNGKAIGISGIIIDRQEKKDQKQSYNETKTIKPSGKVYEIGSTIRRIPVLQSTKTKHLDG